MSHLIDPCLRATKIAHGIRRGLDGLSPMSGLVPELRILIQEQKNVFTSMKRAAFEKEEASKHLTIYAKTEGPDITDTLSKISILIQKSANLERVYADSLAQCRELFKEVRVSEDENYAVRKRKLDLEQRLALEKVQYQQQHHHSQQGSTTSLSSDISGSGSSYINTRGPELHGEIHPELKLFRQETMSIENELEDTKRKRIKKATIQQLDALEQWGKGMIVIAHYGRQIMSELDDTPTPAGTHVDDRHATYDGAAKTAYSVKACMDTFKSWASHEPQVLVPDIDLGDFPKDNKQAIDAMLQNLASKTGSDWFELQSPPSSKAPSTRDRSGSDSSVGSAVSASASSPRISMSSAMSTTTTLTYVDGLPVVQIINEIPPTPESEDAPSTNAAAEVTESTAAAATSSSSSSSSSSKTKTTTTTQESTFEDAKAPPTPEPVTATATTTASSSNEEGSALTAMDSTTDAPAAHPSPFISHSSYKPTTAYLPGHGHEPIDGRKSPRSRPHSGEQQHPPFHAAPHPLMMAFSPVKQHQQQQLQQQQQQQQQPYKPMYPPGPPGGADAALMPMPMPMPMPVPVQMPMPMPMSMSMPVPHIPGGSAASSPPDKDGRHSQPITVSFPLRPPSTTPMDQHHLGIVRSASPTLTPISSASPSRLPQNPQHHPRNPQAIVQETTSVVYDGPPPDYAEAAMKPPAEKLDEKRRQ
ncbi:hypothetical protein BGZ65_010529 [Modicella reniformis]|uniref:Eisosome component PIL1-domain-containing protein n=1 Tax=Modicella reniformis TaxID=1440133 RepID=A0A9P6IMK0_9FUNG|nr:hypothetical protein BGZ65_010529 [Modicella reniformis]